MIIGGEQIDIYLDVYGDIFGMDILYCTVIVIGLCGNRPVGRMEIMIWRWKSTLWNIYMSLYLSKAPFFKIMKLGRYRLSIFITIIIFITNHHFLSLGTYEYLSWYSMWIQNSRQQRIHTFLSFNYIRSDCRSTLSRSNKICTYIPRATESFPYSRKYFRAWEPIIADIGGGQNNGLKSISRMR